MRDGQVLPNRFEDLLGIALPHGFHQIMMRQRQRAVMIDADHIQHHAHECEQGHRQDVERLIEDRIPRLLPDVAVKEKVCFGSLKTLPGFNQ